MFANYFRAAESTLRFQQEMLRHWVSPWPPAAQDADGIGRARQVQAMQKKALENTAEVVNKQCAAIDAQSKAGIETIEDAFRITEATAVPHRHEDVPIAALRDTATAPRTNEGATIRLHEEELHARKRLVETGEVRVRKEVVTEQRTIEVPVQREEIVIERHAPNGAHASATDIGPGEEIRIALREERVTVEKRPVVKEEVSVGKRVIQGLERVGGEVRKEEMRVERIAHEVGVDVHPTASPGKTTDGAEEAEILHRAYLKWLEEGCPAGQDHRHYFEAIKQVRA